MWKGTDQSTFDRPPTISLQIDSVHCPTFLSHTIFTENYTIVILIPSCPPSCRITLSSPPHSVHLSTEISPFEALFGEKLSWKDAVRKEKTTDIPAACKQAFNLAAM